MVKTPQFSQTVTSKNGTYHVGMTRAEAQKAKSYQAKMGIDFKDLDKDGNGELDQKEILEGRVKAAKRDGYALQALGGVEMSAGYLMLPTGAATFGSGTVVGATFMGLGGVMMNEGQNMIADAKKELKEYEAYMKQQNQTGNRLNVKR